jgi:hypothetical protein
VELPGPGPGPGGCPGTDGAERLPARSGIHHDHLRSTDHRCYHDHHDDAGDDHDDYDGDDDYNHHDGPLNLRWKLGHTGGG